VQQQPIILGSGVVAAAAFLPVAEQQGAATFAPPATPAPTDNLYSAEDNLREVTREMRKLERKKAKAEGLVTDFSSVATARSAAKRIQAKELVASTKREFVACDETVAETKRRKKENAKQRRLLVKEDTKLEEVLMVQIAAQKMAGTKASAAAEALDALA
jgi:hypothetical protein